MELGIAGKTFIVTGGASGLGHEAAKYFVAEGANVLLADLGEEQLAAAAGKLSGGSAGVDTFVLDVRDFDRCRAAVDHTIDRFGAVDGIVNSAGVGGPMTFFADQTPADWQDLIGINLIGVMNCCRAVTDHMRDRGGGKIVSLASEAGRANEKRMTVYGTTKGGVISLTRGLAAELGRYGINVNAVCPGVTHTPMTGYIDDEMEKAASRFYPLGRLGRPEDIAPMIVFLCSERAAWITGQAISVNGGFGRS